MALYWYEIFVKALFFAMCTLFFLSGIDELFMIFSFLAYRVYHIFVFRKKHSILSAKVLEQVEQKPIAVMIACWHESNVIYKMLLRAIETIRYKNYHIFVGSYPNDEETQRSIHLTKERFANIHCVIIDSIGPTTKADNINSIYKSILRTEKDLNTKFEIFAIHDAEDHVPAFGLSIFNYLIPRKDVVQLPVLPLKVPYWEFVAGTYLDEFASMHLMNMRTREWMTGHIPTAGVGCGFSREFLEYVSKKHSDHGPLGSDTLTEDYELSLMNDFRPNNEAFFDATIVEEGPKRKWHTYLPAVRSYFPKSFSSAVKQKSRWILGISLQGRDHIGWQGSTPFRYMLFRDRKVIFTNILTFFGMLSTVFLFIDWYWRGDHELPDLFKNLALVRVLVKSNVAFMFILLSSRFICTTIVYGPIHGLLSIPRIFIGNLINGVASIRALMLYRKTQEKGTQPRWDKTKHDI